MSLESTKVKNITKTAKIIFRRTSVEKNQRSIEVKFRVCSISLPEPTAEYTEGMKNNTRENIMRKYFIILYKNTFILC